MTGLRNCVVALFLLLSVAMAQTSTADRMDEYLTRLTGFGFTGAVLVAGDGKVILEKGYGLADRRRGLSFTKDTVIDIGSNTKDLTKTAILQLAQNQKLDLGDRLPKFFANVPADKAMITVEQLMEHTAGLGMYSGRDEERITKEEFLRRVFSAPLIAAPGTEENYSNPGYSVLAAIIEKVSGQSYDQYVQDHILRPAGMTTTGYILPQWRDGQLARNYQDGEEQPATFDLPHLPDGPSWNLRGNGGTLSTVGDMYKFHLALRGDTLLKPEYKAKLFDVNSPLMLVGGNGVHFFVYQTEPANRLVILLATTDPRVRATDVSRRLVTIARGNDSALPPQLARTDKETLARLAGSYQLPSGAQLQVTAKDDHLLVAGTNEAGFRLMQGTTRGNQEQMEKISARVKAMLEAGAKGDYTLIHKALGATMPYDQLKPQEENLWQRRRERFGAFRGVTILGTSPGQGGYVTTARIDCERGSDYAQFIWGGGGMLRGIRPSMNMPGVLFYPQSATEFVNYDLTNGETVSLSFKPQGSRFIVAVQSSGAARATADNVSSGLPDNDAGRIVAAYIKAFNSGAEQAMQEFLEKYLAGSALASRPMSERLKIYQRLRDDMGDLTISSVAENRDSELAVTFQTATGKTAEFIFTPDPAEPQKLKALRIELR